MQNHLHREYCRDCADAGRPSISKTAFGRAMKKLRPAVMDYQRTVNGVVVSRRSRARPPGDVNISILPANREDLTAIECVEYRTWPDQPMQTVSFQCKPLV